MEPSRGPTFTVPPLPQQARQAHHQHPPANVSNWFSPPAPLISPYAFSQQNNAAFNGNSQSFGDPGVDTAFMSALPAGGFGGTGMNGIGGLGPGGAPGGGMSSFGQASPFATNGFANPMRHGSLTQEQLSELMGVLEQDGMGEINQLLSMGVDMVGVDSGNGGRW
ncbi:zinc binuclear cluster-type protein [Magnaporthiopsis poae ATCC 64411]|uniref:Zinc binuclear cluster-type protein n=1 Tax=Magnaporthiopsis poae (strain ATCC 64411 / 73-15) TaxID=644358 RepID=A0A0C4DWQ5_MAGP6|nr:zinc binuclear cluster-type protein [Magnaporthiopsis poae ATCC 64411]